MSFNEFRRILDKVPSARRIQFTGWGEVLLNKNLPLMLRYLKCRGIKAGMISNFTLLDDTFANMLISEELIDRITVSLDTIDGAEFEQLRPGLKWDRFINNIKTFTKIKRDRKLRMPTLELFCVVTARNIQKLCDLVRFASGLGVDFIQFLKIRVPEGQGKEHLDIQLYDNNAHKEIGLALELARTLRIGATALFFNKEPIRRCVFPWDCMFIDVDGYVAPCCYCSTDVRESRSETMGNILTGSLESVWNGQRIKSIRKAITKGKVPPFCRGCSAYE